MPADQNSVLLTAITNPAGMIRIEQRADFSMEAFMPDRSIDFEALAWNPNDRLCPGLAGGV